MTGSLWLLIAAGTILLGAAMLYGVIENRRRRRSAAAREETERATKRLYDEDSRLEEAEEHRR